MEKFGFKVQTASDLASVVGICSRRSRDRISGLSYNEATKMFVCQSGGELFIPSLSNPSGFCKVLREKSIDSIVADYQNGEYIITLYADAVIVDSSAHRHNATHLGSTMKELDPEVIKELTELQLKHLKAIQYADYQKKVWGSYLDSLKWECEHVGMDNPTDYVYCIVCRRFLGWACKESPVGYCVYVYDVAGGDLLKHEGVKRAFDEYCTRRRDHYDQLYKEFRARKPVTEKMFEEFYKHMTYSDDLCIYCGSPEERR